MRRTEFKQWMRNLGLAESDVLTYAVNATHIEGVEEIDLDKEFKKDALADFLERYKEPESSSRDGVDRNYNRNYKIKTKYISVEEYRDALNQYRKFCLSEWDGFTDEVKHINATSELKRQLHEFIRAHISSSKTEFTIIDDGVEERVKSGFIDILAQDKDEDYFIFKLVIGTAQESDVTQILSQMGELSDKYGNADMYGVILAPDFDSRVESAAHAIPNLYLKYYTNSFTIPNEKII